MADITDGARVQAYGRDTMIVLAVLIAFTLAVAYALYALRPSGIAQHPYAKIYGGAPGSASASRMTGSADREVLSWSRGTR